MARNAMLLLALFLVCWGCGRQDDRQEKPPPASPPDVARKPERPKQVFKPMHQAEGSVIVDVIAEGRGRMVQEGATITCHYKGMLKRTGKVFDQTDASTGPRTFPLKRGQVIDGWIQGLVGLREGTKVRLEIPPTLAYGAQGRPPAIPSNAWLVFEIEIVKVQ